MALLASYFSSRPAICRKGPARGGKEVGLGERSKPKFKRNLHKYKAKRKEKVVTKKESAAAQPAGSGGPEVGVRVGSKRKNTGRQDGEKRLKGV